MAPVVEVSAWGNGFITSSKYRQYGIHDAIADYAYRKLKDYNETMAEWITSWYKDGKTDWGSGVDAYLAWTDDPDSVLRDWENHNYDGHVGYYGGPPERGAPSRVQQLFSWIVGNLTKWLRAGRPSGSETEKMAAHSAALLTHYYADISQVMHTDDSVSGNPEHQHPSDDPEDRTYHGYYESASIGDTFLDQFTADLNAYTFTVNEYNASWADRVRELATYINSHDGTTEVLSDGSTVGADYYRMMYQYINQYDEGTTYLDARGWDESLYQENLKYLRCVTGNLTQLFYSAYKEAENNTKALPVGYVVINEFEQNPPGPDAGNEWVELFNPSGDDLYIGEWTLSTTHGVTVTITIPSGTIISSNGYWTYTHQVQWLDNEGESITLQDGKGNEMDRTPIKNDTENDKGCWARFPNGQDTDSEEDWRFQISTKESSNEDTEKPSITVTNPPDDAILASAAVTVTGTAQDNIKVERVEISTDNNTWTPCTGTTSWTANTTLNEGSNTIYVRAIDPSGNIAYTIVNVTIDITKPSITITSPSNGYTVKSSDVVMTWSGSDEISGLDHYEAKIDEGSWINLGTDTTYTFTSVSDGSHSVSVKAVDKAGNSKEAQVSFIVNTSLIGGPGWTDDILTMAGIAAIIALIAFLIIKKR